MLPTRGVKVRFHADLSRFWRYKSLIFETLIWRMFLFNVKFQNRWNQVLWHSTSVARPGPKYYGIPLGCVVLSTRLLNCFDYYEIQITRFSSFSFQQKTKNGSEKGLEASNLHDVSSESCAGAWRVRKSAQGCPKRAKFDRKTRFSIERKTLKILKNR